MNFDSSGAYKVATSPSEFIVHVGGAPCFGVGRDGTFVNHLMVDENGKGAYRRGKNVVHTIQLLRNILGKGRKAIPDIGKYLSEIEVVNVPGHSCHSMITDPCGNTWVVEPGRGVMRSPAAESPYYVMTNFSLWDLQERGTPDGSGADRYKAAHQMLGEADTLDVRGAFDILQATAQTGGPYPTVFSMVYAPAEQAVYYLLPNKGANRGSMDAPIDKGEAACSIKVYPVFRHP